MLPYHWDVIAVVHLYEKSTPWVISTGYELRQMCEKSIIIYNYHLFSLCVLLYKEDIDILITYILNNLLIKTQRPMLVQISSRVASSCRTVALRKICC